MRRIVVRQIDLRVLNMRTRMPFRYGIAAMTALPHLFVRLDTEIDGQSQVGLAAEGLPPKWFTKDPSTSYRQDLAEMVRVIRHACTVAVDMPAAPSVFDWWRQVYDTQMRWGAAEAIPPLLAGLGASLVERAMLDAFCRATRVTFAQAVRDNTVGMRLGELHPELSGHAPAEFLPAQPQRTIAVRHTIGLSDPLDDSDIPPDERLHDRLPQSLATSIRAYGLTHFKVKLFGDTAQDIARLRQLSVVLTARAGERYAFTLDGNEQYHEVAEFQAAWLALTREPSLRSFWPHLLFVEQPLHRSVALSSAVARALHAWIERPPIIIDESDGELQSLPVALENGYAGTSYKNCKGVFRGIANACLIAQRRAVAPAAQRHRYIVSGEDLANVGPVALLHDLAAVATLGIDHVERNGHHYFAGLSMLPLEVQTQVLAHHDDLYRVHRSDAEAFPALAIREGRIEIGSVVEAPFGTAFLLDTAQFTPLDAWDFATLAVDEA